MNSWIQFTTDHLHEVTKYIPIRHITLSTKQKVIVISITASVAVVGLVARYLRRPIVTHNPKIPNYRVYGKRSRISGLRSPNGDGASFASSGRRSAALSNSYVRQSSIIACDKTSIASGSIINGSVTLHEGIDTPMTPQQFGVMGMEALETCITYWEDALAAYRSKDLSGDFI